MARRKPKVEYYWSLCLNAGHAVVNWRLVGGNGEVMCQSNQGFRDKTDAQRSVEAVALALTVDSWGDPQCRQVGPGRRPR